MKKSFVSSLTLAATTTLFSFNICYGNFDSGTINLDYRFSQIGLATYGPGAAAVGSPGDLWNSSDVALANQGVSNLKKTDGLVTTVNWSVLSGAGFGITSTTGQYAKLMDAGVQIASATLNNLSPLRQYELYLFSGNWTQIIRVNGVDFATPSLAHFGAVNTLTSGVNYDHHSVTADAFGQLSFEGIYSQLDQYPSITSWQLVAVPEPSCLALIGAGALAGLRRSRKSDSL